MKIINPVYRQETRAGARSFRLPLIILLFNCVLAVVALLDMYTMIAQVRLTAELQYSSFLGLYVFAATVEFVLLLFFIPGITAGSISGERERQTLELMQTTRLTGADIVFGKLASSLSTIFLLVISSFPILGLVFIYGGVTAADVGRLLLCYVVTALLIGSMGIFCSAISRRTTMATVTAYCLTAILTVGTVVIDYIAAGFSSATAGPGNLDAGWPKLLLLGNPLVMYQSVIEKQMGAEAGLAALFPWLSRMDGTGSWWLYSMAAQLILAFLFLYGSVRRMDSRRSYRRRL